MINTFGALAEFDDNGEKREENVAGENIADVDMSAVINRIIALENKVNELLSRETTPSAPTSEPESAGENPTGGKNNSVESGAESED